MKNQKAAAKPVTLKLEKGTRVRLTADYLARSVETTKRFSDRIGVVDGYRIGAEYPIVYFPKGGRRKEIRLFEVPFKDLEVVTNFAQAAQKTPRPG